MALRLFKTQYVNLKRNTKRHSPSSTYYLDFTWYPPGAETVVVKTKSGETKRKKRRKRERIPLGSFERPEQARAVALEVMQRTKDAPIGEPQLQTLSELQRLQLESKTKLRPGTLKRYELSDRNLRDALGANKLVAEITAAEVNAWIRKRQQNVTNGTINRDLTRLRTLISFALDLEWIEKDPIRRVESLEEPDARVRYLSEEEVRRLWSVCSPWLWRIVWFAAMTGMRKGEIFSLTWSQVRDGQIRLKKEQTKGKKPRTTPVTPDIQAILDQVAGQHSEWVFVTEAKQVRINGNNFNQYWWRRRYYRLASRTSASTTCGTLSVRGSCSRVASSRRCRC